MRSLDGEKLKAEHIIFLSCGGVYLCILIDGVKMNVVVMSFNIMYLLFMLFVLCCRLYILFDTHDPGA